MRRLVSSRRFVPVAILLAATAALLEARSLTETVPPHRNLIAFPVSVDAWRGTDVPLTQRELAVLGPGEFLVRDYQRLPEELPVNLYIAYFPSQRSADSIHSPRNCLPGSGWTPLESDRFELKREGRESLVMNRYIVAKGLNRELVFYWYQAHARVTPSEYWAKIYLVTDAIRMNRTDGALVRVVTPIESQDDESVAHARALAFTQQILPLLDSYISR